MLAKSYLANPAEIIFVRQTGRLIQTPFFSFLLADLKTSFPSKFAFLISKKTASKAVDRNRLRRLFKSSLLKRLSSFPPGYLVLFLIKKKAFSLSPVQLDSFLEKTLFENGLLASK